MGKNDKLQHIGLMAAGLTFISFYSLVIHNFQIQDTKSLSWIWLGTGIIVQILWLIFGFINEILPTMILSPLILAGFLSLLYLKVKLETNLLHLWTFKMPI
jgi:uncharacterized protein with PQ loop repeat